MALLQQRMNKPRQKPAADGPGDAAPAAASA
jgi:hypothetical protein